MQAGVLSLEEEIIDATTEEGQQRIKDMEQEAAATAATTSESQYNDDPE